MSAKFWGKLAIKQFIESNIAQHRIRKLPTMDEKPKVIFHCEFNEDEIFYKDLTFFWKKGLKAKYLYRIFNDLKKSNSVELPATDTQNKMPSSFGRNQYTVSGKISLYDHIVSASKSVFDLKGYKESQLRDAALLVLLHDMGKLKDYLKKSSDEFGVSKDHEYDSSIYAALVISDAEDANTLAIYRDCLENKNPKNRKFQSYHAKILKEIDFDNRRKLELELFGESLR